ncbi:ABC transporter permease [Rhodoferax sp.]|jgi:lipoprotein-releasing system permease protein|uniref:ABC transporter permease n=1 Tax=Rhodoferax sp. TaxID=50421 RepID=UPI003783B1A9
MHTTWLPFEWIVAIRFLREGRLQTLFIIAGVALGVAVIVFMSALISGLQTGFIRRVLSAQGHIQLLPPKEVTRLLRMGASARPGEVEAATVQVPLQRLKSIDQWQAVAQQIRSMPEVLVVSPVAGGSALVVRGVASRAVSLVGIEPALYYRVVNLPDKIVQGSADLTGSEMLVGTELAADLGVRVGDKLRLSTANGADTTLAIAGIFDLGNKAANGRSTFVSLRTAQSLLALPGGVTSMDVTVRDVYAAEVVAQRITAATGVDADSWISTNAELFTAITAQNTSNDAIRFFVGLSVAFGIASVLAVVVVQKSREIGILRAMGISRGQVMRVFLLQGGLLAGLGSVAGSLLGVGVLVLWQRSVHNPDGTPLFALVLEPALFGQALALATVTGLAAALAPARRAARLDPVVAIHG